MPRLGFVTCVRLGLVCLEEMAASGGRFDVVYTLRDHVDPAKSGRVHLDDFAAAHGTELVKLASINDDAAVADLRARDLDWLFIVGWSEIAKPAVLAAPRHGVLGIHPTLLPVGRGRAPIPWAILKRLPETGVTLFELDEGVDTGPIVAQHRIPIDEAETATTLYAKVAEGHRRLVRDVWPDLAAGGPLLAVPQDDRAATVWPRRRPEDGRIDEAMTVADVEVLVRAVTHPYPGAFWEAPSGGVLRVWAGTPGPGAGVAIPVRDGAYVATDFEWE